MQDRPPHETTPNRQTLPSITTTPRQSLSTSSSTPIPSRTVRRKPSATSPLRSNLDKRLVDLEEGSETRTPLEKEEVLSRPQSGLVVEALDVDTKRTSWIRRLSTIAPSIDGSFSSPSFNRPSTPSLFSNGSSAPFFSSSPPPVTPRNKLVKRSTSQKVLHSGYQTSPPFSARTPTFRRPATSYQRSENLRLRNLQQNLVSIETPSEASREPLDPSNEILRPPPEPVRKHRPYFRYQYSKIAREPPTRRASGSKLFGGLDQVSRVLLDTNQNPVLVMGTSVEKAKVEVTQLTDSVPQNMDRPIQEHDRDMKDDSQNHREGRSRSSFSMGDKLSSSPSSWRLGQGGSFKRKKRRETVSVGRRIVSAPHRTTSDGFEAQSTKYSPDARTSTWQRPQSRVPSSPLPPLDKISAFEIDLPGTSSSNKTGSTIDDSYGFSNADSPLVNSSLAYAGQTSTRLRASSNRASRVPSDYSTAFGSDNEQSRVFSIDGDETDRRSETVYDSVRTDSSHSGARNHKIETVFGDHTVDAVNQTVTNLQERLSGLSFKQEDFIAEEEESMQTPIRQRASAENIDLTPAAPSHLLPSHFSSSPPISTEQFNPTGSNSSVPQTKALETSSSDLEDEGFWDDEFDIDTTKQPAQSMPPPNSHDLDILPDGHDTSERPQSNLFQYSGRPSIEEHSPTDKPRHPVASHAQQLLERGSRPTGRRLTGGLHMRSQSVPLKPDNSKHRFNSTAKLDKWTLENKVASEDWDDDFEPVVDAATEDNGGIVVDSGLTVPKSILERQARVYGQFGQVKELSLLVEELRRLHLLATVYNVLDGQSSELWKEAEGIIDLASLDEEPETLRPRSPTPTSLESDVCGEGPSASKDRPLPSIEKSPYSSNISGHATSIAQAATFSSPTESHQGTPKGRPREDSTAKVKDILQNIQQHRTPQDPFLEPMDEPSGPPEPKKMPFDTTSLRDLVTRAGVVTRALKEIIRKAENPDEEAQTPERRSTSPPSFFTQVFPQSSPVPDKNE